MDLVDLWLIATSLVVKYDDLMLMVLDPVTVSHLMEYYEYLM
jgi:hypothetical protein